MKVLLHLRGSISAPKLIDVILASRRSCPSRIFKDWMVRALSKIIITITDKAGYTAAVGTGTFRVID